MLFTSKIRDRKEGIVICLFYRWFSFLTWVWVNIFLDIVSSKTATTHSFQLGVRNWPASVRLTPLAGIYSGSQLSRAWYSLCSLSQSVARRALFPRLAACVEGPHLDFISHCLDLEKWVCSQVSWQGKFWKEWITSSAFSLISSSARAMFRRGLTLENKR